MESVTTLGGEDSLCRRVIKHLTHLVVTIDPVKVKSPTRRAVKHDLPTHSEGSSVPAENTWNNYNEFNEQNEWNEKNECIERILRNELEPSTR